MEKSIHKLHKTFLIIIVLSAFVLGISAASMAVPPSCDKDDSGKEEDEPLKACEEKLNNAQGDLLYELDLLIDEMENTPGVNISGLSFTNEETGEVSDLKEHMAKMKREHGRALDAIAESENEDFEDLIGQGGKEKGQKCNWVEADDVAQHPDDYVPGGMSNPDGRLGDGYCNKFVAYDEDKGKDVWVNERLQPNICVRLCEDKDVPGQAGTKKKDKIRGRHIGRKSEAIDATERALNAVRKGRQDLLTINAMAETFGPRQALDMTFPECDLPFDVPQTATWGTKVVLVPISVGLKIVSRLTEGAKDTAEAVCQQDVMGNNVSGVCAPFIIAHIVAQGAVDVVEVLIQAADLTNEGFDIFGGNATHDCVKSIREKQAEMLGIINGIDSKVNGISTSVAGVAGDLDAMDQRITDTQLIINTVSEKVDNLEELLNTPQGRRPGFGK